MYVEERGAARLFQTYLGIAAKYTVPLPRCYVVRFLSRSPNWYPTGPVSRRK